VRNIDFVWGVIIAIKICHDMNQYRDIRYDTIYRAIATINCILWSHPPRWPIVLAVNDYPYTPQSTLPTHPQPDASLQITCVRFNALSTTPTQRLSLTERVTDLVGRLHGWWVGGTFSDTSHHANEISTLPVHFLWPYPRIAPGIWMGNFNKLIN